MDRSPRSFAMTRDLRDLLKKRAEAHKYSHGHAVVLSGGPGRSGAARLAARGALRVGAGLVTLAVPHAAVPEVAAQITAIMLRPLRQAGDLAAILSDRRISAICLGPGLGLDKAEAGYLATVLATLRPTVLDADALTLLAQEPGLRDAVHAGCVLTPHAGEFDRLFPDMRAMTKGDAAPVAAVRRAALDMGCTVLLKGPETLVACADGTVHRHPFQPDGALSWLATAGSGDVLAGFVTGLLARGLDPATAANLAVWLHGRAARQFGPGLIAEDLPEAIPAVLRDLGV